jgi:hypothetical protein
MAILGPLAIEIDIATHDTRKIPSQTEEFLFETTRCRAYGMVALASILVLLTQCVVR